MSLEIERKKIELKRVRMAKDEMAFKIMERQADIERLTEHMEAQTKRINELQKLLSKEE